MAIKIAIIFTILLLIGEYKGNSIIWTENKTIMIYSSTTLKFNNLNYAIISWWIIQYALSTQTLL